MARVSGRQVGRDTPSKPIKLKATKRSKNAAPTLRQLHALLGKPPTLILLEVVIYQHLSAIRRSLSPYRLRLSIHLEHLADSGYL